MKKLLKNDDLLFMQKALRQARKALLLGEVPIGAVIVKDGKLIASGHNRCIKDRDPSAHAEMIAVRKAAKKLNNYRLNGCVLYVTLEPCAMCAGVLINARIEKIVYGAKDKKAGACGSVFKIANGAKLNWRIKVEKADKEISAQCANMLTDFFKSKRKKGGE